MRAFVQTLQYVAVVQAVVSAITAGVCVVATAAVIGAGDGMWWGYVVAGGIHLVVLVAAGLCVPKIREELSELRARFSRAAQQRDAATTT